MGLIYDYAIGIASSLASWLMLTVLVAAIGIPPFVIVRLYYKHIFRSKAMLVFITGAICVAFYSWLWITFPQYRTSGLVTARELDQMSLLGKGILLGKILPFFLPLGLFGAACFSPAKRKNEKGDNSIEDPLEDILGGVKKTYRKRSESDGKEELSGNGRSGSSGADVSDLAP